MWYSNQFLCEMVNNFYIYDIELLEKMSSITHNYDHNSKVSKVFLDITNKCNIKCKHCFTDAKSSFQTNEMSTENIKKLMCELNTLNIRRLALGGGEPLVRSDIYNLIKYGTSQGLRIHISSNGLLLNEKNVIKLKKCGLDSIQISLDSSNSEIHNEIRNCKGLFEKCIQAINNIKKHNINLLVSTTITKFNINELSSIVELIRNLGVKFHRFIRFVPVGRGNKFKDTLYVDGKTLSEKLIELRNRYNKYFFGNLNSTFGIPNSYVQSCLNLDKSPIGCEAGKISIDILSNGNVVPCNYLGTDKRWVCGNVVKESLHDIIKNSAILSRFRNLSGNDISQCLDCTKNNYCGKGCRAVAYNLYGNVKFVDPCCSEYKEENLSENSGQ